MGTFTGLQQEKRNKKMTKKIEKIKKTVNMYYYIFIEALFVATIRSYSEHVLICPLDFCHHSEHGSYPGELLNLMIGTQTRSRVKGE